MQGSEDTPHQPTKQPTSQSVAHESSAAKLFSNELAASIGLAGDRYPQTKEEVDRVEDALANELSEKLTVEEHQKIILDIHGLRDVQNPPESLILIKLLEFDQELAQLGASEKAAYERAKHQNPEYVENMRLVFLRNDQFDAKAAAKRMALHFQVKYELFVLTRQQEGKPNQSDEILGRNVTWEDLDEAEKVQAQVGHLQVGPKRDLAGRTIFFAILTPVNHTENTKLRVSWYLLNSAWCTDQEIQETGVVLVVFNFEHHTPPLDSMRRKASLQSCIPIKIVAIHYCYRHFSLRPIVMGFQLLLISDIDIAHKVRPRLCTHFGSMDTIAYKLQTYGIPMDSCPAITSMLNNAQSVHVSNAWHLNWLALIREMEGQETAQSDSRQQQSTSVSSSSSAGGKSTEEDMILVPRRFDVLLGHSKEAVKHTGTLRCQHLVRTHLDDYQNASWRGKTEIAERIVFMIKELEGRFLKKREYVSSTGNIVHGWAPLNHAEAREKVSYSFRNLRKSKQSPQADSTQDSGTAARKGPKKLATKRPHSDDGSSV